MGAPAEEAAVGADRQDLDRYTWVESPAFLKPSNNSLEWTRPLHRLAFARVVNS